MKKLLKTEVVVMSQINHRNLMHLYDFLESPNTYYLVMQFCNKGDFEAYLDKQPKNYLNQKEAIYFLK